MGIYWAGPEWLERGGTRTRPRQRLCCVGGSQSFRLNLANLSCHVTKHWSYHEDIGSPSIPLVSFSTADHGLRPNVRATLNGSSGPRPGAGRIAHSPRDYGRRDRRSRGRHGPHPSLRAACWEPAELSMGAHECVRAHHTESFNRLTMPAPTALVWWSVCSRPLVSTPFAVIDPSFINRRPSGSRRTASGGRSGSSGFRESL